MEFFLPSPCLFNFIDVQVEEASRICHLPKCMREIACNLMVKIRVVCPKVGHPSSLH